MRKTLTALAAAAALAVVAVGAPSDASAQGRGFAAGVIGGLAAGTIIGGAIASQPRYYEPAPVYVAPPPRCVQQQWVWSNYRQDYVLRNVRVPC